MEMMVAITIIGIVIGLLYFYYKNGWHLFNKSLQLGKVQSNARAALEQMSYNLKQASRDLIYTNSNYNTNVPLPEDFLYGKPYIYFAVAEQKDYANFESSSKRKNKNQIRPTPKYDYYLYYVARAKNRDGEFSNDKAKLKLFLIKDQDGDYTRSNASNWPVLPPDLEGENRFEASRETGTRKVGFVSNIQQQDILPEFSSYQSDFSYNLYNTDYNNLFTINVTMLDPDSQTKIEFRTSVSPRN
jgi:type II secretory pathway pseudopilin PulG